MRILVLDGPNLNLVGIREPNIYGRVRIEDYLWEIRRAYPGHAIDHIQTNHEGEIIDHLQDAGYGDCPYDGVVLNAGGYTHTSVAIRDAIAAIPTPVVEVHLSEISQREVFRHVSLLTDVCCKSIIGHGLNGYGEAIEMLIKGCENTPAK